MGFISNGSENIKIVTKLTPYGRQQILRNSNTNVIKYFSLGDSEANYQSPLSLNDGEIPVIGGNQTGGFTMSDGYDIKNKIFVDNIGNTKKAVGADSSTINVGKTKVGQKTLDNTKLQQFKIDRRDFNSDNRVNWLYSLGLPITNSDKALYTTVNNTNGGFSNTALSTINNDEVLLYSIDDSEYGELIDGKSIHLVLDGSETYNIYGTFQSNLTPRETQDTKYKEITNSSNTISSNIIFLFSDNIQKPNNDDTKSWSTGFSRTRPYSVNGKELFNLIDDSERNLVKDVCVGVAYLDKGIIAITHPTIVNDTLNHSNAELTLNSIYTEISIDITCTVGRGEFTTSQNKTYNDEDVRVSEIGIYDGSNNLIALSKPNRHIIIGNNEYKVFNIKISV